MSDFARQLEADLCARVEELEAHKVELEREIDEVNAELRVIYDALRPFRPEPPRP